MRVGVRMLGLAVGAIAALLPAASADAASFFKSESSDASIVVHVVDRRIVYLELEATVTCDDSQREERVAYSVGTAIDRRGRFKVVYEYYKTEQYRGVLTGTILNGVLQGEYEYGYTDGFGHYCWSGGSLQGTSPPEGSPVPITVSRVEGLRFYEQPQNPQIYMWVGHGRIYGLTLTVRERCGTPDYWYENDPFTTGLQPEWVQPGATIRVNSTTHRFRFRDVDQYRFDQYQYTRQVWTVSGLVERRRVRGFVSYVDDYHAMTEADSVHCQTGDRSSPKVPFEALRG